MQNAMTPITVKSAFESLQAAGYPRRYVTKLLPDWWDNSLLKTSAGALQFALILKQRLGLEVSFGKDGNLDIQARAAHVSFKHRADTHADELNVAASLGIALARLAVFAAKVPYTAFPQDPAALHAMVLRRSGSEKVDFEGLLDLCWAHGIPVLFLKEMPRNIKKMTGMAVVVYNRPAILLGYNYAQHSKQLFVLAHELSHIICGHVQNNGALIDEDIADVTEGLEGGARVRRDEEEKEADAFALQLIRNGYINAHRRILRQDSAATLAMEAMLIGNELGIDPGHLILSYGKEHDDWMRANQALNFTLLRAGAIDIVQEKFLANIESDLLSAESAQHLFSMQGFVGK